MSTIQSGVNIAEFYTVRSYHLGRASKLPSCLCLFFSRLIRQCYLNYIRIATLRQCYACVRPNARQCNAPKCNHDRGGYFFGCYLLLGCSASMTAAGRLLEHISLSLAVLWAITSVPLAQVSPRLVQIHFLYCYCVCAPYAHAYVFLKKRMTECQNRQCCSQVALYIQRPTVNF